MYLKKIPAGASKAFTSIDREPKFGIYTMLVKVLIKKKGRKGGGRGEKERKGRRREERGEREEGKSLS